MEISPAHRRTQPTPAQHQRRLMQAAWRNGFTAVPRGGDQAALVITPQGGVQTDRRGRLHLAPDTTGTLRWHWSDSGAALSADLLDTTRLLAEIRTALTPGRAS